MSQNTHFHSSNCLGQTTLESFLIPVSLPFQIPTMNKLYSQNILGNWPLFTHSNSNVPYILLSQSIQRDHRPLLLKTPENHTGHIRNRTAWRGPWCSGDSPLFSPLGFPTRASCQAWSCPGSSHSLFCLKNSPPRYLVGWFPHFFRSLLKYLLSQTRGLHYSLSKLVHSLALLSRDSWETLQDWATCAFGGVLSETTSGKKWQNQDRQREKLNTVQQL